MPKIKIYHDHNPNLKTAWKVEFSKNFRLAAIHTWAPTLKLFHPHILKALQCALDMIKLIF